MKYWTVTTHDGRVGVVYAEQVIPDNVVTMVSAEWAGTEVVQNDGMKASLAVLYVLRDGIVRSAQITPVIAGGAPLDNLYRRSTFVHKYSGAWRDASGDWELSLMDRSAVQPWDSSTARMEAASLMMLDEAEGRGVWPELINAITCPRYAPNISGVMRQLPAGTRVWDTRYQRVVVAG
ncbi:hypothetical protein H5Q51_22470 [Escherichia coli]|uniref:hypothetical protein n=1 Tax=Escherichia coli TaxID=562 RepID=UPI00107AE3F2|nr:hypothetical protein [Escherichia coli]EEC7850424.1 hypothetical protein [Escherichia coli]MBZ8376826.1 hypothetical protein [Escherichia coli]MCX8374154.1 hypothetical protein [Escherichia coli]UIU63879.1 hypothetical protein H6S30_26450 [Escherichia coli]